MDTSTSPDTVPARPLSRASATTPRWRRFATGDGAVSSPFPRRTIALGTIGAVLMLAASIGAGGILVSDPVIGTGQWSWLRYGHGRNLATAVLYIGFGLVVWAWVRLGRYVLMHRVGVRPVLVAAGCWMAPLLFAPPLFTRDVFAYLAQGALLYDHDPYTNAPNVLTEIPTIVENVYSAWQSTPSPYGPVFLAFAKGIVTLTGDNPIAGVIVTRIALLPGLALLVWALTRLVRHLGGNPAITMWLAVASPMTVIHLIGGPHNELLMLGPLLLGVLLALERKHVLAIVVGTVAMLIKPTAAIALPFIVWIWTNHLPETRGKLANFLRAGTASVSVFVAVYVAGTFAALGSVNLGWLGGLEGPQLIKNWLNFPTGIGQLTHVITNLFTPVTQSPFITGARGAGWVVLAGFGIWQWWKARNGGTTAVYHLAVTLIATAMLAPPTLPWYFTWGFVIAACFAWQVRHLAIVVGVSVFLVLVYYPTGEQALHDPSMVAVFLVSGYAAWCLLRPDPLGIVRAFTGREEPAPADDVPNDVPVGPAEPVTVNSGQPTSRSTG
ncbi:polyprenol phosphomannose-dependent alpha 1,6 mannosyltransferase MptB [Haloechinothrix salitolerans]|uniref:Polyprenol phosphomannose-dependent alpha 1,6 mannosyltransferase MptB n=1 Tax=Haloechinothrix salitolerans TaxID=926830 RepID=A0ABW2C1L8_9PSEU